MLGPHRAGGGGEKFWRKNIEMREKRKKKKKIAILRLKSPNLVLF